MDELRVGGKSPHAALCSAFALGGVCYTMVDALDDGAPMGMFGVVAGDDPRIGVVWALTCDRIRRRRKVFHAISKQWVAWANDQWPYLVNVIWAGNLGHLIWLRALGFALIAEHEINGHIFYEFVRTKQCATLLAP